MNHEARLAEIIAARGEKGQRHAPGHAFFVGQHQGRQFCSDETRRDSIDPHIAWTPLHGKGARQLCDAGLRQRIGVDPEVAPQT